MLWKNTVTPELLSILEKLQENELFKDYILAGGTALALQIGHRRSDDIDLFTTNVQDNEKCLKYFFANYDNVDIINNNKNILQIMIGEQKIDLLSVKGIMIESPLIEDNLKMFNLKDIIGMKLLAIQDRKKAKDYVDIVYLLKEMTLEEMFNIYKIKYKTDNIYNVKSSLMDSRMVNPYTWSEIKMIRNEIFLSDIPRILEMEIKEYNKKYGIGKRDLFGMFRKSKK